MRLTVFHYHLHGGGVTGVIKDGLSILLAHGVCDAALLVSGDHENLDVVTRSIRESAELPGTDTDTEAGTETQADTNTGAGRDVGAPTLSTAVYPELRYAADIAGYDGDAITARLMEILEIELLDPEGIWWIHNHHLGKNPAFTRALATVLRRHPEQRCILEIHDFPEAGRYSNLVALNEAVPEDPYPVGPGVHYAVLNDRDRDILVTAGIPEASVTVLRNPVKPMPPVTTSSAHSAGTASGASAPGNPRGREPRLSDRSSRRRPSLAERLARHHSGVAAEGLSMLYPVRCIRRKNVLEAAVTARLLEDRLERPVNLLITLPGLSEQERRYSRMVEDAYHGGLIRGAFGFGDELEHLDLSFPELLQESDMIISSSVQEGFGYAFFEGLASGTPLLARYLDVLTGTEDLFSSFHARLYHSIMAPFASPSLSDTRAYLRSRYDEQLDTLSSYLPTELLKRLEGQVAELLHGETIDFSFLMPQMQYTMLRDLADAGFRAELRQLNAPLMEDAASLPGRRNADANRAVQSRFGAREFAERFRGMLIPGRKEEFPPRAHHARAAAENPQTAGEPDGRSRGSGPDRPIQRGVMEQFATVDYLRLLYSGI